MSHRSHLTGISRCSFAAIDRSVIFRRKLEDLTCRRTPFCDCLSLTAGGSSSAGRIFPLGALVRTGQGAYLWTVATGDGFQTEAETSSDFLHVGDLLAGN